MHAPDIPQLLIEGVSIVIPVGPGDTAWRGLVDQLSKLASRPQILLVFAAGDAQSLDVPAHCTALSAPAGRAHQLNAGIASADGAWLWLLHADSRLQPDTWTALRDYLADAPRALGWFQLAFAGDGPWLMPLNALGANLRARWFGLPFGDQGFVLHRDDAARLGPFDPSLSSGEDHAWIWRARRIGLPLLRVSGTVATSARKYSEHGWLRTTLRHLCLTARQARQESQRP
ncbi:MAG: glycosyltransferase [Arenimonas sp.]